MINRYELTSAHDIMSSPSLKKSFQDVACLAFCQNIEELRFNDKLTSTFSTRLRRDKVTIDGVVFTLLVDTIATATGIPNTGELWFKNKYLDLENYKMYLKPPYKTARKHISPFRHLLDKYAHLMKMIMKYFTCEGRFSILYEYHVRLLMHFTGVKVLNLPYYLYRSMVKMGKKVHRLGEDHHASLFHHGLVKILVCHLLAQINLPWDGFIYSTSLFPSLAQSSSQSTPLPSPTK